MGAVQKSFFRELDILKKELRFSGNDSLVKLCRSTEEFVLSGSWTSYKRIEEILRYWGRPDHEVAKGLGLTESTARVTRRNLSKKLYSLFGNDYFELFRSQDHGSRLEIRERLSTIRNNKKASDFFPLEYLSYITENYSGSENPVFNVKDCQKEISFLLKVRKLTFTEGVRDLDVDKLYFLLLLLDGKEGKKTDKYKFEAFLESRGGL